MSLPATSEAARFITFLDTFDTSAGTRRAYASDLHKFMAWFTRVNNEEPLSGRPG